MVSAPSVAAPPTPSTPDSPSPWPARTLARAAFKVLLGAPLAALGIWAVARGHVSVSHESLLSQVNELRGDGFSLDDLGNAYPPAPVILALTVGASAAALAIVSSMLAGSALHAVWERMVQREVPPVTQLTLICSVTLVPSVWYLASQDVAAIGGLSMLVIALAGFVRFVFSGDTSGGFTAGLFVAAAFLFDPAALAYALTLVLVTPLLASARYRGERAATRALISVLCFPIAALLLGWAFLEWRFDSTAFGFVTTELGLFQFETSAFADLGAAALDVARDVAFAPVYIAVATLLILRRPIAGLGYLIPVAGLILVHWSGLAYSPTTTLVLLTFLAMVSLPGRPGRMARWLLPAAAVVQLALNIAYPPELSGFQGWLILL